MRTESLHGWRMIQSRKQLIFSHGVDQLLLYFRKIRARSQMGVVILGTAIAAAVTSEQIQELTRKINEIISRHQAISDDVQRLSDDLKKLDLSSISDKLDAMNESLAQNLKTILADQQTKLQIIEGIDPGRLGVDPRSLFQKILDILNIVSTIFTMISIMCATNPATIAISGIMLVINYVFNVITLINNLKTLEQLKAQHAELQEYFKEGGQFEQQVNQMADLSFDMMENFYVFVVHYRSMIFELAINVDLLSLSNRSAKLNYPYYIDILKKNPFTSSFQMECLLTYRKFIDIKNYPKQRRVNMSSKILDEFDRKHDLAGKIELAGQIASNFKKDSPIGQELAKASNDLKKITVIKEAFKGDFQVRLHKNGIELQMTDKRIFNDLMYEVRKMQQSLLTVIVIVSFYTTTFYADDPSGRTLMGENLEQMHKKTASLNYIGVNSGGQNVVELPQPEDQALRNQWNSNRKFMETLYSQKSGNIQFQFNSMFMRMEVGQLKLYNGVKSKLNYFYGIRVKPYNSMMEQFFELPASEIFQRGIKAQFEKKFGFVQKMEEYNENLQSLCSYVWFFINGIAYPERVTNLKIEKVGTKYKATVQWTEKTLDQEIFGKFLDYNVSDIPLGDNIPDEPTGTVFFKTTFPESNSKVLFNFK